MTAVQLFVCHSLLIGIMFSVVHADWTLSVRLISYYKPYSVLETAGATGSAYCCCDCSFIGFSCCDGNVDTANDRCVVRKCPTRFRVCARQGSGSEICSSTTSPFKLDSNFTFSEGGTYGGLQNPIHLIANQNSTSDKITLVVSIMEEGSFGQSPSLGSSTVMIPPQTTTTYTRMTFNNNKEKPLTAQLTYAYKLNCSDCPSDNGNKGTNSTNNTTDSTNNTNSTNNTTDTNTNGTDGTNITSVNVNCSLSVRLINYHKPYSVLETAGARGSAYCCCDCSNTGFRCCDRNVDTVNGRCVVRKCPTHFRVCARQGSGSEICSSTTSPFELDSNFTFSEGGTYGGLENPIQLTANNLSSDNMITLVVSIMERNSTGQSLGNSTVMISPQTTTTYTRMTFNNNKEKPLTAQLIYAYKLNCPSTNGNGSNGINTTDSTTSAGIYSPSPTGRLSTSSTGSPPSSTGSSTGSPPSPTGRLSTSSTGSPPSSTGSPPSPTGRLSTSSTGSPPSSTGSPPSPTGRLSTSSTGSLPSSTGSPPSPTGRLSTSSTGSLPSSTGSPPSPTGRLSTSSTGSLPSSTGSPPSPTGRLSTSSTGSPPSSTGSLPSSTGSSSQSPSNSPTGSPSPTDRPTDNTNRPTTNYPTTNRPTDRPTDGIVDNNRISSGIMIKSSLWMLILITLLSAILIQF